MKISIIIPALNEEARIEDFLNQFASHRYADKFELIIVDGSEKKTTLKALNKYKEKHEASTSIKGLHSQKGRALQMNLGAQVASGDILLFLHVDTFLPKNWFQVLLHECDNNNVRAGAFSLAIDSKKISIRLVSVMANLRSMLTRVPYGDQAIFLCEDYFNSIGQFRQLSFLEDLDLMLRIKRRGERIKILSDKVTTSSRRWQQEGVLYTTFRNWFVAFAFHFGVNPDKIKKYYHYYDNPG